MNVEKTLKYSLMMYPSIHKNRWDVYHHLFCVNGNGYDWVNGELVDMSDRSDITLIDAINKHLDSYIKSPSNIILNFYAKIDKEYKWFDSLKKELKKNIKATINWEEHAKDFTSKRENKEYPIYPLCQYAKILNIPEDIEPDWRIAALEMYEWLKTHYNELGEGNQKWIDKIKF